MADAASVAALRGIAAGIGVSDWPSMVDSIGIEGGMREITGPSGLIGLDKRTGAVDAAFFSLPFSAPVEVALDNLLLLPDVATSYPPELSAVRAAPGLHSKAV